MTRPKLLDLFCGAGGASVGYHRAGFDVTGVDIEPHPDYPYELIVADASAILLEDLADWDAIHASPPCQAKTTMSNRWRGKGGKADSHPDLISWVRLGLLAWGGPYVIENVPGARSDLRDPVTLHGGMFGLRVNRPRLFEANFPVAVTAGPRVVNPLGVYGKSPDGRRLFTRADGTIQRAASSLTEGASAMGIDWMTRWEDVTEAIPPAYTEFIGRQLLDHLAREAS